MYILVDGYNILKQVAAGKDISERERQQFINRIRVYAQNKGHEIAVIFDGGPDVWISKQSKHGVTIIYSGIYSSADDVIKKLIKESRIKQIIVVSSDNELARYAYQHNATPMDAVAFYALMSEDKKHTTKKHNQLVKTSFEDNQLVDVLMKESGAPTYLQE